MSSSSLDRTPSSIVLLGPQRLAPNLVRAVDRLGVEGRIAAVTAGWQEREREHRELAEHLGRAMVNLELHRRAEQVFAEDPELFAAYRRRQDRLRLLLRYYRYRLDFTIQPARELLARGEDGDLLAEEVELAIEALRRLDAEYLRRVGEVHRRFEAEAKPGERLALVRQRHRIEALVEDSEAVAIAGGHVAVLLYHLRLFDLPAMLGNRPVFAWSAGAMALAERIVLFHDHPPQGAGNAEVLEKGIGLYPSLVPLPHARYRLRLGDPDRVALFARRFAPATCVPLDTGDSLSWSGGRWHPGPGTKRLDTGGEVVALETLP